MSTDLQGTANAVHGRTILTLKTSIYNTYMSIVSQIDGIFIFINAQFLRYLYISKVIEFMIQIRVFQQILNLITISLKCRNFNCFLRQRLQNYAQFNLLVSLFDILVIVLLALTLARSFIMLKTITANKDKSFTIVLISFQRSWSYIKIG